MFNNKTKYELNKKNYHLLKNSMVGGNFSCYKSTLVQTEPSCIDDITGPYATRKDCEDNCLLARADYWKEKLIKAIHANSTRHQQRDANSNELEAIFKDFIGRLTRGELKADDLIFADTNDNTYGAIFYICRLFEIDFDSFLSLRQLRYEIDLAEKAQQEQARTEMEYTKLVRESNVVRDAERREYTKIAKKEKRQAYKHELREEEENELRRQYRSDRHGHASTYYNEDDDYNDDIDDDEYERRGIAVAMASKQPKATGSVVDALLDGSYGSYDAYGYDDHDDAYGHDYDDRDDIDPRIGILSERLASVPQYDTSVLITRYEHELQELKTLLTEKMNPALYTRNAIREVADVMERDSYNALIETEEYAVRCDNLLVHLESAKNTYSDALARHLPPDEVAPIKQDLIYALNDIVNFLGRR